ncbi:hypothetical protein GE09DRAFT_394723 [Coniochaeta sp. 2T2.1]|nr:hypothetical protein GE09DRAFT_394723 [Coniochaeta sp. 2T2.1]
MLAEWLAEYRSQLTLRLLMVLNKQQTESLQAMRDDIVEVVSVNIQDMVAKVGRQKDETIATMIERDKTYAIAMDEPIAAVFKTRSGNSTAVGRSTALSSAKSRLPRTSITYSHDSRTDGPNATDMAGFRTAKGVYDYEQIIIDALHFRSISERQSRIDPAYATTFDWMWDGSSHPEFKDVRWDPLGSWLRDRSPAKGNCYWVSGKAGSGKSSLFSYAQQDPRLARHLGTWAGTAQLVVSSFYFWYAGTDLQKSHVGLLRALLFGVLTNRPELAAILFPHICRVIISGDAVGLSLELSLGELKAAFSKLVQSVPDDLRICFVIDGIDEYTGDHNELCELLLQATGNTFIKALVSSRPIPSCCDRFRLCPTLRLQDLTRHDIHRYVTENLGHHHLIARMEKIEPGMTRKIVREVVNRASGIFLWVVLVVRRLVSRLQTYTLSTSTLLEEVFRLPPDLEELYAHMLGSMSKQNQILGSKFLQLLFRQLQIGGSFDFTLLQLSFAEECDYEACLKSPFKALTREVRDWRCEATEGRLRASCCGLCEVRNSDRFLVPCVAFIHRTVVEFLQIDAVWDQVTLPTSKPPSRDNYSSEREFCDNLTMFNLHANFNADVALRSSSISELKAMTLIPKADQHVLFVRMGRVLDYEEHLDEPARLAYHNRYLDEMRRAVTYHRHNSQLFPSPEQELAAIDRSYDRARRQLRLSYPHSVLLALNIQGFYDDPYKNLHLDQDDQNRRAAHLMIHMFSEPQGSVRVLIANSIAESLAIATEPVSFPAGPVRNLWNDRWKQAVHTDSSRPWSLWEFMLHYCYSIVNNAEDRPPDFSVPEFSHALLVAIIGLLIKGDSKVRHAWDEQLKAKEQVATTITVRDRRLNE